jgi:hypothetical protein
MSSKPGILSNLWQNHLTRYGLLKNSLPKMGMEDYNRLVKIEGSVDWLGQVTDKITTLMMSMEKQACEDKRVASMELRTEITAVWVELGRDPNKIKLYNKTNEELVDALDKLKVIRMSFGLLFKKDGNHQLAVHLLSKTFLKTEDEHEEE